MPHHHSACPILPWLEPVRSSMFRALAPICGRADEPTNHLDLEACVWLEETLKSYPSILLMVSHSQDFLNGVCNNIIYMGQKKLTYYSGVIMVFSGPEPACMPLLSCMHVHVFSVATTGGGD